MEDGGPDGTDEAEVGCPGDPERERACRLDQQRVSEDAPYESRRFDDRTPVGTAEDRLLAE